MATTSSIPSPQDNHGVEKQGLKAPSVQLLLILYLLSIAFALGMGWPWPHQTDIWWHLKTGEWIANHHAVPWTDPFGANTQGEQWIAYSWLAELMFYWIDQAQPLLGLHLLQGCLVATTVGILLFNVQLRSGSFRLAILLCTLFLAPLVPWVARPQIFSFLFTALTMLILWWGRHRNPRVLWILPLLLVLWANIHVYFIVGIGLIALHFLEAWKRQPEQRATHILILLLCMIAPLLNPYGIHLYQEVFLLDKHGSEGWASYAVKELSSPDFHEWPLKIFFFWVALAFTTLIMSGKKASLLTLFLFLGLFYQSLLHQRDFPYFIIVMLPIIAEHLTSAPWEKWRAFFKNDQYRLWHKLSTPNGLIHWAAAIGILTVMLFLPYRLLNAHKNIGAEYFRNETTGSAEYLLKARPPGPLFHPLDWGCYFIYSLTPIYKVYIDGRTQLYSDKFWKNYNRIRQGKTDWEKLLDDSGVRTVIWEKNTLLARLLSLSPQWTLAWSDEHAVIYLKRPSGTHQ